MGNAADTFLFQPADQSRNVERLDQQTNPNIGVGLLVHTYSYNFKERGYTKEVDSSRRSLVGNAVDTFLFNRLTKVEM